MEHIDLEAYLGYDFALGGDQVPGHGLHDVQGSFGGFPRGGGSSLKKY
jgi:hypothetical protein